TNGPATRWSPSRSTLKARGSAPNDLARLDAGGAHVQALLLGKPDPGVHGLDVRVPPAVRAPVRVRDPLAEARPLATDVAHGSHVEHSSKRSVNEPPGGTGQLEQLNWCALRHLSGVATLA